MFVLVTYIERKKIYNKQLVMDKPTYEKFKRYCISKNYGTDEYIKSLYDYLDERKWKKANGGEPVNWMILTDANFGVFNAKGKFSRAIREKLAD